MGRPDYKRRYIVPFYHASFEFYAPYASEILSPIISIGEYDEILSHINGDLPMDMLKRKDRFRRLAVISFSTLVCLVGFILLFFLYRASNQYEKSFIMYTYRILDYIKGVNLKYDKRGLRFSLRDSTGTKREYNYENIKEDPYNICLAIDLVLQEDLGDVSEQVQPLSPVKHM